MTREGDHAAALGGRLGISVAEAARAIRVAERHLRQSLPEIPHLHVGRRVVIPIESFREWLRARPQGESQRLGEPSKDVLEALDDP